MSGCDDPNSPHNYSSTLQLMGVERTVAAGVGGGAGAGAAAGAGALNGASEPPRKRPKLAATDDAPATRRRLLEAELARLRSLRERFTEQLSELYFLQAGGNMMDYAAWRKRPPTAQLLAFLEARRPPPVVVAAPAPAPAPPPAPTPAPAPAPDEMVEKAKQEAYVASRVAELARAGLWPERRLPRVMEPPRPKTHWDYLLEEMAWLAQDFAHERKWKKQAAKKCARAVQKYFQDKALAAQRAEKAQELQLKKIAAFAAKEIRTFWSNVEKLVEWKRVRRVERARKEALDEQLSYIVDKTERYSRQLAANLAPDSARPAEAGSDDEFEPRGASDDDEETIAAAEREAAADAADHRDEIEALRRESRLELTALLPPGYVPAHSPPPSDYGPDDDDSADDEETIDEQERAERPGDHAAELDDLRDEAELDIAELRRKYAAAGAPPPPDDDDDETDIGEDEDESSDDTASTSSSEALEALVEGSEAEAPGAAGEGGERRVEAAASLAATLQPTGTTLSSTCVGTPVPRLLKHALREYQHVGLHWLATMHARRLNGILADEMGLGKTIQTIALLAHLALERRDWGPHLVVAPTSVVLNWEMEFKKWCPAFKILTYYGTIKERKLKRVGWTKANSFHVCITSYKLVVQDHQSFRRKRWKYLILDEAQNIKNFKSQRWQMLLNFQTERRLLLTGTPLQNSLLELWSLMHFLMPDVFASHSEFREWFGDVASIAEGSHRYNEALVRRLHEVLRPFLLRRLKADVERQMPRKYEHVLMCRLAKRQRFLYDDFMARAKTKECLASGNLLSVINVLMQLRKVCNHPDLFEPRPVSSPLQLPALLLAAPALALHAGVAERVELAARLGGDLASLEAAGAGAFAAHRARHLAPPRRLVEEAGCARAAPPRPPPAALRLHLRLVPRRAPAPAAPPAPRAPPAPPPAPPAPAAPLPAWRARLEARRRACLRRLAAANERRCWRLPLYGADLRAALQAAPPPLPARTIEDVLDEMHQIIDRFSVCWCPCRAGAAQLVVGRGAGARAWRARAAAVGAAAEPTAAAALRLLHAPASRQAVAFPHPRLLQYDAGKLQTLDVLLRKLKAGGHRVLIFTQMTRVLDVLEGFLSMHGHTYLRLDGATRVDQRQPLVDRFNADARVFAFILSTRSGGVGLNLTGADSVVFYDSDWNPTMDAQAQDRCHRIGQTRDVHVFWLVTANTVEENILRKADQKRALGHLAIEGGHFTTSYLRASNIKDLFNNDPSPAAEPAEAVAAGGGELESALAAAEDEADARAALAARQEAATDLAEFDESVPLADAEPDDPDAAPLAALMKQLTPVEKYAMRVVESSEDATAAERAALDHMRRQLHDWEHARQRLRDADEPAPATPEPAPEPEPEPDLTYCRADARAKVWVSETGADERMPMWCPPTPPSGDGDVYCEGWARTLYRRGAAPDHLLPPAPRREPRAAPRRAPAAAPPARAARRRAARAARAPAARLDRRRGRRPAPRPPPAAPAARPARRARAQLGLGRRAGARRRARLPLAARLPRPARRAGRPGPRAPQAPPRRRAPPPRRRRAAPAAGPPRRDARRGRAPPRRAQAPPRPAAGQPEARGPARRPRGRLRRAADADGGRLAPRRPHRQGEVEGGRGRPAGAAADPGAGRADAAARGGGGARAPRPRQAGGGAPAAGAGPHRRRRAHCRRRPAARRPAGQRGVRDTRRVGGAHTTALSTTDVGGAASPQNTTSCGRYPGPGSRPIELEYWRRGGRGGRGRAGAGAAHAAAAAAGAAARAAARGRAGRAGRTGRAGRAAASARHAPAPRGAHAHRARRAATHAARAPPARPQTINRFTTMLSFIYSSNRPFRRVKAQSHLTLLDEFYYYLFFYYFLMDKLKNTVMLRSNTKVFFGHAQSQLVKFFQL